MDKSSINTGLKEFLDLSLAKCLTALKARSGSIFLLDKQKNELILEASQNARGLHLEGVKQKVGEGIAGRVALKKAPLLVGNVNEIPHLKDNSRVYRYQTNSFISIPLEHSGSLIGVISITDRISGDAFNDQDLNTVLDICKYLGIAIYSLRRYLESQRLINQKLIKEIETLRNSIEHSKSFSSLGKLAGGFVHELNNPLDGIIRYVNLALDYTEGDGVVREYLLEIKQGLNRIVKIVRSLLDFSWNLSGSNTRVDVNRAIDECLFMLSEYIFCHRVEVNKDFSPNLPKLPDYRLKIAFTNIIKNACVAMNEEGGKLYISTALGDGYIEVVFTDTGPGIPENLQEKIFEPFFTTKNIGEGAGLGLAICYETIQRYNGEISVKSKPGEGATFIVRLPISLEEDLALEPLDYVTE